MNTTPLPPKYQAIEDARSDDAILLESINHELTVWFCSRKGFGNEIDEYNTAIDYIRTITDGDEVAETVLLVQLAKDFFRSLYGRNWEAK